MSSSAKSARTRAPNSVRGSPVSFRPRTYSSRNRASTGDLAPGSLALVAPDGSASPVADADGAVWYADVPNQRCQRVREGGEILQTVTLDRGCFASMHGGADRRTLFMLAAAWGEEGAGDGSPTGQLLTIAAPGAGAGWP